MKSFSEKISPKAFFENADGAITDFSVKSEKKCGFTGYYITASANADFSRDKAVEFEFDCDDLQHTAIYSHSLYWVQPSFGNKPEQIPPKTAAVIFKNADGSYTYIMTAIGSQYKTYIQGDVGKVKIFLYSQKPSNTIDSQLSFVVGYGKSITELVNGGAEAMCKFMDNGLKLRSAKAMPEVLEYFGWCSWDAFQIRVNHDGLLEKAREFKSKGVPVRYAVIDDMWGNAPNLKTSPEGAPFNDMVKVMHASSLRDFEGDPERFPKGLRAAVSDLKAEGIDHIGLWFPTTGYWYGLEENGPAHELQRENVEAAAGGRIIAIPDEAHAEKYFDIFVELLHLIVLNLRVLFLIRKIVLKK